MPRRPSPARAKPAPVSPLEAATEDARASLEAAPQAPTEVDVVAVSEHINAGVRRHRGEWFRVAADRLEAVEASGLAMSEASIWRLWAYAPGRVLTPSGVPSPDPAVPARGAIRVLHLCEYDPGSAAYRYHSAANTDPRVVSAFVRWGDANPHSSLRQWDGTSDRQAVELLLLTADVVHVHIDYATLLHHLGRYPSDRQVLVRHYHGSVSSSAPRRLVDNDEDARMGALQIGARLYHHAFSDRMQWLPIPVPVDSYAALAREIWRPSETLRVAHAPTVRAIKGTDVLERAVAELRAEGVPIELVLIEGKSHAEALRLKAGADVTFDSFWLGIQGSGLEGAAMGQVVVAGDPSVADDYRARLGECPYTFATAEGLAGVLRRLATDPEYRKAEAARVGAYVRKFHDYRAVSARYADIVLPQAAARGRVPEV